MDEGRKQAAESKRRMQGSRVPPRPRTQDDDNWGNKLAPMGLNPVETRLYTQFVDGNEGSLDGVNEYRLEALEAYATLLFGASSDRSRSCGKTITADPPRRKVG